jgi:glycosyltransferase involved in cell wall biosynthesis
MTHDDRTGRERCTSSDHAGASSILIVGPTQGTTGGIARYITEQRQQLPSEINITTHDTGAMGGSRSGSVVGVAVRSVVNALQFPFRTSPDLLHVHMSEWVSFYRNSFYVLFAAVVWRCPIVLHVHAPNFDDFVKGASLHGRFVQRYVFAVSNAIILLSERWRAVLDGSVEPEKLRVIPNGVDPEVYTPSSAADTDGSDANHSHVVFIADHVHRKGIAEFIAAISALDRNSIDDFRVSIAGDGPLSKHAIAAAERHPHVEYHGYVSEEEKRRLLSVASIYVLPTHAEGLPIGILEAMASGNAIVSTPVGDIPDIVDEENGILVKSGDSAALADALAQLIGAPERAEMMGERSRERIEKGYTWSMVIERLIRLYNDVICRQN